MRYNNSLTTISGSMDIKPLKIYTGELLPNFSPLPFLRPNLDLGSIVLNSFSEPDAFSFVREPFFEIVSDPNSAEYLLIPHNFFHIKDHRDTINHFIHIAESLKKKILIFALGDSSELISIPNSIVFRTSQYRSSLKFNEIIVPAFVPDMLRERPLTFLHKKEIPVVGFCGWADFKNTSDKIKYLIKNLILYTGVRKQGIYFRLKSIASLRGSVLVTTNFIIRPSHFGSKKIVMDDPFLSRREYIENILNSDFTLSPKGDGNYSVRFYETLSLGRIPLLIDTDTPLPLEDELRYEDFILRVDYTKINELPRIVSEFYSGLTDEQLVYMQKRAREAYEQKLCPEVFLRRVFDKRFLIHYE